MREYVFAVLILFFVPGDPPQNVPTGWQVIKDTRGLCQVAAPPEWAPYGNSTGAAALHDAATAMVVVTSQPQQTFGPLPDAVARAMNIPKARIFENGSKRVFYQDKVSKNPNDTNSFSFSVPGKTGTCSGTLSFIPSVTDEVARKIVMSLGPVDDGSKPD